MRAIKMKNIIQKPPIFLGNQLKVASTLELKVTT